MSIRPVHVARIVNCSKGHEFRRGRMKVLPGQEVLVYETAPASMITARFTIGQVLFGPPEDLAALEPDVVARRHLAEYFALCPLGTALQVEHPVRLETPAPLASVGLPRAPQAYAFAKQSLS